MPATSRSAQSRPAGPPPYYLSPPRELLDHRFAPPRPGPPMAAGG